MCQIGKCNDTGCAAASSVMRQGCLDLPMTASVSRAPASTSSGRLHTGLQTGRGSVLDARSYHLLFTLALFWSPEPGHVKWGTGQSHTMWQPVKAQEFGGLNAPLQLNPRTAVCSASFEALKTLLHAPVLGQGSIGSQRAAKLALLGSGRFQGVCIVPQGPKGPHPASFQTWAYWSRALASRWQVIPVASSETMVLNCNAAKADTLRWPAAALGSCNSWHKLAAAHDGCGFLRGLEGVAGVGEAGQLLVRSSLQPFASPSQTGHPLLHPAA